MPHADTTPATPTPEGLAAALALIDELANDGSSWWDDEAFAAAMAVARTAIVRRRARLARAAFADGPLDLPDDEWEAVLQAIDAADAAEQAADYDHDAAVARLIALATGAKAGEGAASVAPCNCGDDGGEWCGACGPAEAPR